jgi:hypothetical protein
LQNIFFRILQHYGHFALNIYGHTGCGSASDLASNAAVILSSIRGPSEVVDSSRMTILASPEKERQSLRFGVEVRNVEVPKFQNTKCRSPKCQSSEMPKFELSNEKLRKMLNSSEPSSQPLARCCVVARQSQARLL